MPNEVEFFVINSKGHCQPAAIELFNRLHSALVDVYNKPTHSDDIYSEFFTTNNGLLALLWLDRNSDSKCVLKLDIKESFSLY